MPVQRYEIFCNSQQANVFFFFILVVNADAKVLIF